MSCNGRLNGRFLGIDARSAQYVDFKIGFIRTSHNPEVAGSSPVPAPKRDKHFL